MHNLNITQEQFVLIHGLTREARHWGDFTSIFKQTFPAANIHTPDIPGNGRLHAQPSPITISGMTKSLRGQIPVRSKLNLIGISMGGMIAIDWMIRFPAEIGSATLINTSARPVSPFYQRLRWQIYPAIMKMLFLSRDEREREILALVSNRHGQNIKLLNTWLQWQHQYPVSALNAANQLLAATRFSISCKPLQPVLIVTSTADRLVDYRCSLKLHQQWNTDYSQHDHAGHDLSLDDPVWLADQISQWFSVKL